MRAPGPVRRIGEGSRTRRRLPPQDARGWAPPDHAADGSPSDIVGPYGHTTTFGTDSGGYLSSVTDPAGAASTFTYTPDGLMLMETDARGGVHQFTWDSGGRLLTDSNPAGKVLTFSRTKTDTSSTVTRTTSGGLVATYATTQLPSGVEQRVFAEDISTPTTTLIDRNKQTEISTDPDGTKTSSQSGPDPRWGMNGAIAAGATVTTPSGTAMVSSSVRSATLSVSSDPFSLQTQTDTATTNATTTSTVYTGSTRTSVNTSPVGRKVTTVTDALGRPVSVQVPGVAPVSFAYDARGRLQTSTQNTRTTTNSYDSSGNLQSVTDALSQAETFDHDAIGRLTARHRADGTVVGFGYDALGNLTSVTPPGKPTHLFTYTPDNRLATYTAPDAGNGPATTGYTYDIDGHPTSVARPDGSTVTMGYDSFGRMKTVTLPTGTMTLGFDPVTSNLVSAAGPYGVNFAYGYDGRLLTNTTWSGAVAGSVGRTYDSFFRVATETVNGQAATAATFGYDNDGLITSVATPAGSMALTYDAPRRGCRRRPWDK